MSDPARVALRVVLAALVPIMIGCARLAPELMSKPADVHLYAGAVPTSSTGDSTPPRVFEPPRQRDEVDVDLYGNDITDAVAKYQLDADGSLYELHSPQTQLPRLGSPKS